MAVQVKPMTLERFLQLPEEKPALEFVDGAVRQKVSPKVRHIVLQRTLAERINQVAGTGRHAEAFPELRVTFGEQSRVPDVAVFRWDRVPLNEAGEYVDDIQDPPEIVIEIVSPEQSVNELVRKCLWYIAHGVQIALLIDPDDRSVVRFSTDGETLALSGEDVIDLGETVPDFGLSVQELFGALRRG